MAMHLDDKPARGHRGKPSAHKCFECRNRISVGEMLAGMLCDACGARVRGATVVYVRGGGQELPANLRRSYGL